MSEVVIPRYTLGDRWVQIHWADLEKPDDDRYVLCAQRDGWTVAQWVTGEGKYPAAPWITLPAWVAPDMHDGPTDLDGVQAWCELPNLPKMDDRDPTKHTWEKKEFS